MQRGNDTLEFIVKIFLTSFNHSWELGETKYYKPSTKLDLRTNGLAILYLLQLYTCSLLLTLRLLATILRVPYIYDLKYAYKHRKTCTPTNEDRCVYMFVYMHILLSNAYIRRYISTHFNRVTVIHSFHLFAFLHVYAMIELSYHSYMIAIDIFNFMPFIHLVIRPSTFPLIWIYSFGYLFYTRYQIMLFLLDRSIFVVFREIHLSTDISEKIYTYSRHVHKHTYIHTRAYSYIHVYAYMCMCVWCVYASLKEIVYFFHHIFFHLTVCLWIPPIFIISRNNMTNGWIFNTYEII